MKKLITQIKSCFTGAIIKNSMLVCLLLISLSGSSFAQISRSQIMANANSYSNASYKWTATASNKWLGTYCNGKYIYYAAPAAGGCVITGTNWGMPYSWGGWSSISQHNTAMANGKSAGDVCSSSGGGCNGGGAGLACASGMDCSGFISRVWNVSSTTKYNCTMLNSISTPILASQVQAGDIYNRNDHVRLVATVYTNGNRQVVESSVTGWRVQYNTWTPSQLSSYTPRVYNNSASCGTPTSVNVYNITASSATFKWTSSGATNFTYYLKTSGSSQYTVLGTYNYKPVTITGLSAGTTYNFKVAANCSNGSWGISSVISFTTPTSFSPSYLSGTLIVSDGNTATEINEEQSQISQVLISPNPGKSGQEISLRGVGEKTVLSIYSLEGKLMFTEITTNGNTKLNLPINFPASIYILNLKSEKGFTTNKRFVITE